MAHSTDLVAGPALEVICPSLPRLSFTQGVLAGQLSFVILSVLFLKYFVFEDPSAAAAAAVAALGEDEGRSGRREAAKKRNRPRKSSVSASAYAAAMATPSLLAALDYDLPSHAPESLDWLNVLMAQALAAYRTLVTANDGGPRALLEKALNRDESDESGSGNAGGMMGIDRIEVLDVVLGDKYPLLSNARVRPSGEDGGVRVEVDLDFHDSVSLSISTCLLVNFPRPRFAVLPISLGLTLERFSGTLTIELPPPASPSPTVSSPLRSSASQPPPPASAPPSIHLSLHPDFTLDIATTSLIGSRAKLQDVPKVEQLIRARVRAAIMDRVVWPGRVQVALPSVGGHGHGHGHGGHGRRASRSRATAEDESWDMAQDDESRFSPSDLPPSFTRANGGGASESSAGDSALDVSSGSSLADGVSQSTNSASTPSIDLNDPTGPKVTLHPKLHPATAPSGPATTAAPTGIHSITSPLSPPGGGSAHPPPPPALSKGGGRGRWLPQSQQPQSVSSARLAALASVSAAAASASASGVNGVGDGAGLRLRSGTGTALNELSVGAGGGGVNGVNGGGVNGFGSRGRGTGGGFGSGSSES